MNSNTLALKSSANKCKYCVKLHRYELIIVENQSKILQFTWTFLPQSSFHWSRLWSQSECRLYCTSVTCRDGQDLSTDLPPTCTKNIFNLKWRIRQWLTMINNFNQFSTKRHYNKIQCSIPCISSHYNCRSCQLKKKDTFLCVFDFAMFLTADILIWNTSVIKV